MITVDSILDKCSNLFPITFQKGDNNVLHIYCFNGSPCDGDIRIATLDMNDLDLEVYGTGHIPLGLWFKEGVAFDEYDFSDLDDYEVDDLLNSDISEEQFIMEILSWINWQIEETMGILDETMYHLENVAKKLSPIVDKQTKEASK